MPGVTLFINDTVIDGLAVSVEPLDADEDPVNVDGTGPEI